MKIDRIKVGYLECNCYILDIDGFILIIDPGSDSDKIINIIDNRKVLGIIITHHHFDHDGECINLSNKYGVKIYDYDNLCEGENVIDKFRFDVIYTPGHKEDLISLYFRKENILFCGDFIFKGCIGRCDLPGGNYDEMINSIKKIWNYSDDMIIYPGHGEKTSLGLEKKNNKYLSNI